MDARNDDSSGGSDSLDKSLQRKCVMDDVGQGEGKQADNNVTETSSASVVVANSENSCRTQQQHNKTEKTIGDCGVGVGVTMATVEALNKRACDETTTATTTILTEMPTTIITTTADMEDKGSAISNNNNNYNNTNNNNTNNNNNNNNNNAFETKVKQISKDLKETTLAEYNAVAASTTTTTDTNESSLTTSSSSSSASSTSSEAGGTLASATGGTQLDDSGQLNVSDSADDIRSKKVRFHPDVKENDGGNRVIPKKKKKLKNSNTDETGTVAGSSQRTSGGTDDEMDYEEEDEAVEEEEEFDLAKTIAEAQNYLKLHPLTFVGATSGKSSTCNSSGRVIKTPLHNGLLQEEDLPQLSESSEDEDYYEEMTPECGVERILGKQIRNNKTLLLVRFVNDDGLYWENEERIAKMCPIMMSKYEINRERRQERLMRHVAKRQNLRQRYTDF